MRANNRISDEEGKPTLMLKRARCGMWVLLRQGWSGARKQISIYRGLAGLGTDARQRLKQAINAHNTKVG